MKQCVGLARTLALDALTRSVLQDELLGLLEDSTKTILLVTHDVDEALLLADRVMVLSRGPRAYVKSEIDVPFERPRDREEVLASSEYPELHRELMGILTQELAA